VRSGNHAGPKVSFGAVYVVGLLLGVGVVAMIPDFVARLLRWALGSGS